MTTTHRCVRVRVYEVYDVEFRSSPIRRRRRSRASGCDLIVIVIVI